jgi:hypothetical protein
MASVDAHNDSGVERPASTESLSPGLRSQDSDRLGPSGRRTADRSCILCHRRKVRCDKRLPCAACVRGGRQCCYPGAPELPRRRRPRKTTIADVLSRVSDLEKTIVSSTTPAGGRNVPRQALDTLQSPRAHPAPSSDSDQTNGVKKGQTEILVQNGTSSQYVNETIVSRMIEAVRRPLDAFVASSMRLSLTASAGS